MRALVSAVALSALLTSTAFAGPKEDALAVLDKWAKAFSASDVDGIVKLYRQTRCLLVRRARRSSSSRKEFAATSRMRFSTTGREVRR